jgi:hypothetical protein
VIPDVIDFVSILMFAAELVLLYLGILNTTAAVAGGRHADVRSVIGAALLAVWGVTFL